MESSYIKSSIFGTFDGLTSLLGVVISLLAYTRGADDSLIFTACMGLAVSSAISMGLGEYISSDKDAPLGERASSALLMGFFTGLGCILPAIPFALLQGSEALVASGLVYAVATLGVALLKVPDMGWWRALATTYIVSAIAMGLVIGVSLFLPVPPG